MNVRDSDFDALLAEWLEDDAFVAPVTPVEAAVDFARTNPRRRDRLAFLRRDAMTLRTTTGLRPVAIAVAVAALLAFVIGGAVLIGSAPEPTPTPLPSATAVPTATPVAHPPLPATGGVAAWSVHRWGARLDPSSSRSRSPTTTGRRAVGTSWIPLASPDRSRSGRWAMSMTTCCDSGSLPAIATGPTVDDLVAALDAQAGSRMSPAVDVVVGGYSGKHVTMTASTERMH